MSHLQSMTDVAAVGFSVACAVHCLLLPVAMVAFPSVVVMVLGDEAFHQGLLLAVLPASLIALTLGCRRHKRYWIYGTGLVGLTLLVSAAFVGHDFGEWAERILTLAGAAVIALSHVQNYRLCQRQR